MTTERVTFGLQQRIDHVCFLQKMWKHSKLLLLCCIGFIGISDSQEVKGLVFFFYTEVLYFVKSWYGVSLFIIFVFLLYFHD